MAEFACSASYAFLLFFASTCFKELVSLSAQCHEKIDVWRMEERSLSITLVSVLFCSVYASASLYQWF